MEAVDLLASLLVFSDCGNRWRIMFIYWRNCGSWGIRTEYYINRDNDIGNFVGELRKQGETEKNKI